MEHLEACDLDWLPELPRSHKPWVPTVAPALLTHPLLAAFSSVSHLLTLLLVFPGVTSQIYDLHLNPRLKVNFQDDPN